MARDPLDELFLRFRERGDVAALTRLFDRAAPQLLALASHLVREADQAEDLVQSTFVTAIERAADFDGALPLFPWLVGILNHKALLWNRRASRRVEPARLVERAGEADPAASASRVEISGVLRRAIEGLPAIYARVLLPYFEEGKRPREIARERGLAPGTVRAQLHRGIDLLRRALPGGFALGAAALVFQTRGMAALRAQVEEAARRASSVTPPLPSPPAPWPAPSPPAPWPAPSIGPAGANVLVLSCAASLVTGILWMLGAAPESGARSEPVEPVPEAAPGQRTEIPARPTSAGGPPSSDPLHPSEPLQSAPDPPAPARPIADLGPERAGVEALLPPSAAFVRGGETTIGSQHAEIARLLQEDPDLRKNVRALDAETPQQTVRVADFFLMVTEVTIEQYAAFVRATGHRWPDSWEDLRWLAENALRPVVSVDFDDARAYARWAGMRLPTEQEFQRAARGDGAAAYPWGRTWFDGAAATAESGAPREPFAVGSFEAGASADGIFDLTGNVWEWTDSSYVAYPGFRPNAYAVGEGAARETLSKDPRWDATQRVAVGGSFQHGRAVARVTVRRPCTRDERAGGLGLRCAASPRPGLDVALEVGLAEVRDSEARPGHVSYDLEATIGMDRWESRDSSAEGAPPGYRVITRYEHVVFTPVEKLEHSQDSILEEESQGEPQHVGFLASSEELLEPALPPGNYLVAYRAAPEPTVLFYDARSGEVAATLGVPRATLEPTREESELRLLERGAPGARETLLQLELRIACSVRDRALELVLELRAGPEMARKGWRR